MKDNTDDANNIDGAGTKYFNDGFGNPNNTDAVPDIGRYMETRPFNNKVIATEYDFNMERPLKLNHWPRSASAATE